MAARWCDDVCGFHRRLRGGAMMTEGEVIRHPGRWWQLCVAPYFADRGVGDMRGAAVAYIYNATPEAVAGCRCTIGPMMTKMRYTT